MEKEFDIIVVGELNVDLILNGIQKFPEVGKEVLADHMALTLGSSSAIFASNISSLGARVAFIGKIGSDIFGELVLKSLRENGVDVSMIKSLPDVGTGATIVLNVEEDRANTTYPGAMNLLTLDDIPPSYLERGKHVHFSSYFLQPGMRNGLGEMFRTAQGLGLSTSFDMQWDPLEAWDLPVEEILPHVNVFLPNEQELLFLTGETNLEKAIEHIGEFSDILAIKQGNRGSTIVSNKRITRREAFINHSVVDAIGAGDSFNAGFIYKYIKGESVAACQEYGNLTGAVSTTAAGGITAFRDKDYFKKKALEISGIKI